MRRSSADSEIDIFLKNSEELNGFRVVHAKIDVATVDELRTIGDRLRDGLKSGVGVLGAIIDNKLNFICVVTDDLIKNRSLNAGDIVNKVAEITGGKGGGKSHLALAGGKESGKLEHALDAVSDIVSSCMKRSN